MKCSARQMMTSLERVVGGALDGAMSLCPDTKSEKVSLTIEPFTFLSVMKTGRAPALAGVWDCTALPVRRALHTAPKHLLTHLRGPKPEDNRCGVSEMQKLGRHPSQLTPKCISPGPQALSDCAELCQDKDASGSINQGSSAGSILLRGKVRPAQVHVFLEGLGHC